MLPGAATFVRLRCKARSQIFHRSFNTPPILRRDEANDPVAGPNVVTGGSEKCVRVFILLPTTNEEKLGRRPRPLAFPPLQFIHALAQRPKADNAHPPCPLLTSASTAAIRFSSSSIPIARQFASMTVATTLASSGVISPSAIAAVTTAMAWEASANVRTGASPRATGRPLRSGAMRSRTSRAARMSPFFALATTTRDGRVFLRGQQRRPRHFRSWRISQPVALPAADLGIRQRTSPANTEVCGRRAEPVRTPSLLTLLRISTRKCIIGDISWAGCVPVSLRGMATVESAPELAAAVREAPPYDPAPTRRQAGWLPKSQRQHAQACCRKFVCRGPSLLGRDACPSGSSKGQRD